MTQPKWIWSNDSELSLNFCESLMSAFDNKCPSTNNSEGIDYLNISTDTDFAAEDQMIFTQVNAALEQYLQQLQQDETNFSPLRSNTNLTDTGYWIQRLRKKVAHSWQQDAAIGSEIGAARVLSCMIFLNDLQYGGDIEFLDGTKIKPHPGRILIYPATWNTFYQSSASKDKHRYAIFTGFYLTNTSTDDNKDTTYA
jgi:hypothetical protein